MKVVITSATAKEVALIKQSIDTVCLNNKIELLFHESGVGMLASCFAITKMIFEEKPDLIIQTGIAGTFDKTIALGHVVAIEEEHLADTGVEEDGNFKDLFDLNLQPDNLFPFTERQLKNPSLAKLNILNLPQVTGITINEITTRPQRIEQLKAKYHPVIEAMEGAALHYCCLQTATSFLQIRSVSNFVGERDKSKWDFKNSLENLSKVVTSYITKLCATN